MSKLVFIFLVTMSVYINADPPRYLYKVVSLDEWNKSQETELLSGFKDSKDVTLAKYDQLESTILKDYGNSPEVIIVEIDTDKLNSPMLSSNDAKSYHYAGKIPLKTIGEPRIIRFQ